MIPVNFADLNDSTSGARGDMERRETKNTSFVEKTREEGIRPMEVVYEL